MASSSDEGEIIEDGTRDLKATSLARHSGNGIDRQDRNRSRQSSPDHDSASRYSGSSRRSRSPRGHKRPHDGRDSFGRGRDRDDRYVRSRYDNSRRDEYRRSRVAYDDLDRPTSYSSGHHGRRYNDEQEPDGGRLRGRDRGRYGDGEDARYSDRQPRPRSRSPRTTKRFGRSDTGRYVREGQYDDHGSTQTLRYDDDINSGHRHSHSFNHSFVGDKSHTRDNAAVQEKVSAKESTDRSNHPKQPEPEPEQDYEEPQQIDEDAEIERRRRRREELLAKSSSATPLLLHAVGVATDKVARGASPASTQADTPHKCSFDGETPRTPRSGTCLSPFTAKIAEANSSEFASPRSPGPSPGGALDVLDDKDLMNTHNDAQGDDEDGPSAANYDPTADMKEDERRHELRHGQTVLHGETITETVETRDDGPQISTTDSAANKDEEDFDMFADDIDVDKYASKHVKAVEATDADTQASQADDKGGILEGDDKDGYYKIRIGEVLNGRYQVQATLGRGMFSGVARAVDITTRQVVAIKMMRNNDALRKGGYTEIAILQKLNDADPENRKHIVKFERHFDYRGHLCMAFENLSMNLREVLRKFGNNVGINLGATRTYAYQIFVALAHMRKCSIVHADIKPDNILVNEQRNVLKICDLGTAIDRSDAATAHNQITPYLVSRFYRAPEIILGMPYDYGVDMWSIGCTLYEMYTGKILFTGDSNNQMLKAIMEIRGRFTPKLFRRGQLSAAHFDEQGHFVSVERDKILGKTAIRTLAVVKPARDLRTRLHAASTGMNDAEARHLNHFVDLLEQCLALNPDKRITPSEALKHPFFISRSAATNGRR
ncbi:U4/U6 small nuclear ribonucleoprotein prp4 [Conoideocrella luteorostrata]|uniref:non-specific serine/threonine protein kinase n=1 Tax=Conoideocrella luteorostrata TaxID=1105319 RepID=A0AAJ0CUB5_9HYPO|nr:U4/U6 small nuclear ribonucleoprotein prp4 [Conoideocrella luteorostrata]